MNIIKRVINVLLHNRNIIYLMLLSRIQKFIPDKPYVKLYYYLTMGKKLNLKNPKTFNEKLNWLKLYDRIPLYTTLVDKYEVKDWVKAKIGEEYVIPTLGVWDSFEEIPFDELPNQFVLKTTHGGGSVGVVICKDKQAFDKEAARKKLNHSMHISGYEKHREWPYKNVHRRIIAEKYMEEASSNTKITESAGVLNDYKFFCFDGEVKYLFIATERQKAGEEVKFDFFDADFNHLNLVQHHPMSGKEIQKPQTFDEMKRIAGILSEGIPQIRCDLYEIDGKVYFGEMTFFHHGGVVPFHPEKWDYEFGSWIKLPKEKTK